MPGAHQSEGRSNGMGEVQEKPQPMPRLLSLCYFAFPAVPHSPPIMARGHPTCRPTSQRSFGYVEKVEDLVVLGFLSGRRSEDRGVASHPDMSRARTEPERGGERAAHRHCCCGCCYCCCRFISTPLCSARRQSAGERLFPGFNSQVITAPLPVGLSIHGLSRRPLRDRHPSGGAPP